VVLTKIFKCQHFWFRHLFIINEITQTFVRLTFKNDDTSLNAIERFWLSTKK